jgi:GntR family transcriptional regulator, transcriptional repressor for pyruvate dehydrogenase complex
VRLASEYRTAKDVANLRAIVDGQKSRTVTDPEVPDLDARFHASIAAASGNRVLASFVHALHRETEPLHYLELSPEVGRATVRQHQAIVRAIAAQDPDAAETAVVAHLTYLREHVLPAAGWSGAESTLGADAPGAGSGVRGNRSTA